MRVLVAGVVVTDPVLAMLEACSTFQALLNTRGIRQGRKQQGYDTRRRPHKLSVTQVGWKKYQEARPGVQTPKKTHISHGTTMSTRWAAENRSHAHTYTGYHLCSRKDVPVRGESRHQATVNNKYHRRFCMRGAAAVQQCYIKTKRARQAVACGMYTAVLLLL